MHIGENENIINHIALSTQEVGGQNTVESLYDDDSYQRHFLLHMQISSMELIRFIITKLQLSKQNAERRRKSWKWNKLLFAYQRSFCKKF